MTLHPITETVISALTLLKIPSLAASFPNNYPPISYTSFPSYYSFFPCFSSRTFPLHLARPDSFRLILYLFADPPVPQSAKSSSPPQINRRAEKSESCRISHFSRRRSAKSYRESLRTKKGFTGGYKTQQG